MSCRLRCPSTLMTLTHRMKLRQTRWKEQVADVENGAGGRIEKRKKLSARARASVHVTLMFLLSSQAAFFNSSSSLVQTYMRRAARHAARATAACLGRTADDAVRDKVRSATPGTLMARHAEHYTAEPSASLLRIAQVIAMS